MTQPLRYATIGTSAIVEKFCAAGREVDGFAHTVVYSRARETGEAFAARHGGGRVETSLDALAGADDVDVVYLASPNALHHDQAAPLLAAGKHVLVEKTAASTAAEFRHLLDVAAAHGTVVLESLRSLHDPSWAVLEELVSTLGAVRRVTFSYCQRSSRYDRFNAGEQVNIFDPALSAGALLDIGTYCVNPLVHLLGAPEAVQAAAVLLRGGIDGSGTLLCTYPGATAEVIYSKIANSDAPSEVQGEEATLVLDVLHDPRRLRVLHRDGTSVGHVVDKPRPQQAYVLDAMARFVADPGAARPYQATTLAALEVMDAARAQVGVRFPADDATPA